MLHRSFSLITAASLSVAGCGLFASQVPVALVGGAAQLDEVTVPAGFRITVFAEEVEGARSLSQAPDGTIFVGSRDAGNVYALRDKDGDGVAEEKHVVAEDLNSPNGVAFRDGALYVAEISRVLRYDGVLDQLGGKVTPAVVNDTFPSERHHGWKFIRFGPDGKLYVPVGAPCNVCDSDDERFSSIMRMNADGSDLEVFAHGVRNTVGFDWHPQTKVLWFTENGRDNMGNDVPPDELNVAPRAGMHFGFPYCHGRDIPDPEHGGRPCDSFEPPVTNFAAHVAALGMRFYEAKRFPEKYRGGIFVAEHGSWNRDDPIGYRVMFVPVYPDRAGPPQVFASGWLKGSGAWGRPVDVLVMRDGSLLVSDDKGGVVYRIDYVGG